MANRSSFGKTFLLSFSYENIGIHWIFVLCMGYLSYVWGISLMFWKKIKITCHPGATMAECIVLCITYCSILVLCLGY